MPGPLVERFRSSLTSARVGREAVSAHNHGGAVSCDSNAVVVDVAIKIKLVVGTDVADHVGFD